MWFFYWWQTLRTCMVLRLSLVWRWQDHVSLWAHPKTRYWVRPMRTNSSRPRTNITVACALPPSPDIAPAPCQEEQTVIVMKKRKLKCYNGREKVFDLYKLGEKLLIGADLETYQQILQDQKSFLRSCDSICFISVPCVLHPVLREPWLLRASLDSRNKLLELPRLDWSSSGWTETGAGRLRVVPPKHGLGSGLILDWREALGTTFSPGQFLHHSIEKQP